MNKTLTRALLSATVLASGVVGVGSVVAQASDGGTDATSAVLVDEEAAPVGLQVIDDADDAGTDVADDTEGDETEVDETEV
uniref:hypothetical protein n=1 Tax=Ilumatobacter nonamiensis TaxID=467093 RepID=UPI00058CF7BF